MKSSTSVAETTVIPAEPQLRTITVPATGQRAWREQEVHVIAANQPAMYTFLENPTDSRRRSFSALSVTPDPFVPNHPVHTAKIGDTWSMILDGEQTPEYEYIGRFKVIGEFLNADTKWRQYVIQEVPSCGQAVLPSFQGDRPRAFSAFEWATAVLQEHEGQVRA